MNPPVLPQNVTRLEDGESFCFACHPAIACFTDCCRQLELPLTPYDILRLKKACALTSEEFLDRFVIIEHDGQEAFPRFYLSMVDDGRESCVFVAKAGCTVYEDRPGACRAYPLGRAAIRQTNGDMGNRAVRMDEFFVLLKESHCQGFAEQQPHTASSYSTEQGLERYNHFNSDFRIVAPCNSEAIPKRQASNATNCISTLLLKVCHKKQENQAAIFNKFSVDAAKNAFTTLVNFVPLRVN